MRNGDCRIVHREYIQDVFAGAASGGAGTPSVFLDTPLAVNPGQANTFPWLSSIAGRFESYQFRRLKFCYETEAPSSLGGTLVLSLDYDASDAPPTSKQQALAYRNAVRSAPWTTCCHSSDLEDISKQRSYFVRPAGQPAGTDIKMYDTGNIFIITQGVTTPLATLGELYVEYDVMLMTPVLENFAQSGFIAAAVGGTVSLLTPPITVGGNLSMSSFGNVVSFSGLQIGAEYLFSAMNSSGTVIAITADTGITSRTVISAAAGVSIQTFITTATQGTITYTLAAAATDVLVSVVLLSPSPTF